MDKMSKLKKMKMPEKKGEEMDGMEVESKDPMDPALEDREPEVGLDLDSDMEAGEPGEKKLPGENPALEAVSDEELMAELKKRGLTSKMDGEEPSAEADDLEEMYS